MPRYAVLLICALALLSGAAVHHRGGACAQPAWEPVDSTLLPGSTRAAGGVDPGPGVAASTAVAREVVLGHTPTSAQSAGAFQASRQLSQVEAGERAATAASGGSAELPSSTTLAGPIGSLGTPVRNIITQDLFDEVFMHRNDENCEAGFYTYQAFITAAESFPAFGTSSADPAINMREIAAFFAHISQETTGGWDSAPDGAYAWGLCFKVEGGKTPTTERYCDPSSTTYPCVANKMYYGRGPIQLSWNYNYGPAGQDLGFDGLNNPDIVAQDPVVSFKTALWFWMKSRLNEPDGKPSCHDVMMGNWTPNTRDINAGRTIPSFGVTINIVNGGKECGPTATDDAKAKAAGRIGFFQRYTSLLGTTMGASPFDCAAQKDFRF